MFQSILRTGRHKGITDHVHRQLSFERVCGGGLVMMYNSSRVTDEEFYL